MIFIAERSLLLSAERRRSSISVPRRRASRFPRRFRVARQSRRQGRDRLWIPHHHHRPDGCCFGGTQDATGSGITSFKLFMAYKGAQMVDDLTLLKTFETAAGSGAIVMIHAENGDAVLHLQRKLLAAGKTEPVNHALSRPPITEAEATARALMLAEIAEAPVYIVHVTCEEAVREVARARKRRAGVFGETCTHYLYLTAEDLAKPGFEGAKHVLSPALRRMSDHGFFGGRLPIPIFRSSPPTMPPGFSTTRRRSDDMISPRSRTEVPVSRNG